MKTLEKEAKKIHDKVMLRSATSIVTILTIISIIIKLIDLYRTCNKTGSFHDNIGLFGRIEDILIKRTIRKSVPNVRDADIIEEEILDYLRNSNKKTMNVIYNEYDEKLKFDRAV